MGKLAKSKEGKRELRRIKTRKSCFNVSQRHALTPWICFFNIDVMSGAEIQMTNIYSDSSKMSHI